MAGAARVPATLGSWSAGWREAVLVEAEACLDRYAATPEQAVLLRAGVTAFRQQAEALPDLVPAIHLPLLVYSAICGTEAPALLLAAATTLLYVGIDLCDDLADGDLPPYWAGYRPAEVQLASATLLAALPQRVLAALAAPAATGAALQATLAQGLLRMSAGQQQDLRLADSPRPDPRAVEASVAAKSGAELALFAALAAQLAEAPPALVEQYVAFGEALGTAGQLGSDCADLFSAPHGKDLANGTRTLPIALYLERLDEAARADALDLLDRARHDDAARTAVRERLTRAGVLRRVALVIEVHCQRARRALAAAAPREPAASRLRTMIDRCSFFSQGG